ncbi:hypothetical protein NEUTE2DRAFT_117778 [Neurospora tetrasperma FGSC 2509]|nr:hypothetical protein NEUTE2DRAFT_117778 [Neurospora tetrasperma FGSC 2509]
MPTIYLSFSHIGVYLGSGPGVPDFFCLILTNHQPFRNKRGTTATSPNALVSSIVLH